MHRFFVKPEQVDNDQILFNASQANQIKNVLRLSKGDRVLVLDNKGSCFTVEIFKSGNNRISGNIIDKEFDKTDSEYTVSLGQALVKGSKTDFIIQKATELGVDSITFIETERSIVRYKDVLKKNRLSRWRKIAQEAAEQSHRLTIPEISCNEGLENYCNSVKNSELKLIFWEEEKKKRLRDCFNNDIDISRLSILIGPEGGFSKKEIALTEKLGFVPVGLGKGILKTETAVVSILSIIQYIKGELG